MSVHKSKVDWAERCPIRDVLERMGDRWSMLVLLMLNDHQTMRFSVLKNAIGDISQRMLSQTLRRLEQDGLVLRTAHATVPPRVDYSLTSLGESFMQPMRQLLNWADENHQLVRDARVAYVPPPKHEAL
ncbi:winged helix-turn-helix transcriptional regulator [Rhodoferax mekongensis]|uniref:Helix-turn-helix domain-containing protein n=1 Tax=Rhodoferax mekongensis TaxID=3068341 RepID=A0ABZ0AX84_9BURK|nr:MULTISPECIES: helix-turn-helix domain-containing protein [unclassified Rhodoferax]MDT7515025.1 helix-turn-helix domain-containing protein [Rhodoferax sp. TBRC 17199]WNO04243.1 helix-turn-helix domain-containing protein [Rhodoferax sp. TBRC 17307]